MVAVIESAGTQFIVLQFDGAAGIVSGESYHESAGIGPGLAVEIGDVVDLQPCLFMYFTADALFQCLTGFQKAGYKSVERTPEVARMYQ